MRYLIDFIGTPWDDFGKDVKYTDGESTPRTVRTGQFVVRRGCLRVWSRSRNVKSADAQGLPQVSTAGKECPPFARAIGACRQGFGPDGFTVAAAAAIASRGHGGTNAWLRNTECASHAPPAADAGSAVRAEIAPGNPNSHKAVIRLQHTGVVRIFGGGFDVFTDPRLHSYRRDGAHSGRMVSLVWLLLHRG